MNDAAPDPQDRLLAAIATLLRVFLVSERQFPVAGGATRYSPHDFQTLAFVERNPDARPADLTAYLQVSPTTTTAVLDRLVRRGLIDRRPHPEDGRARALRLTEAGSALRAAIHGQDRINMAAVLEALDPAERESFVTMIEQVARALDRTDTP